MRPPDLAAAYAAPVETGTRLLFPLLSNARALVAGAGVAAVRRKLKFASVMFDEVLLEGGSKQISAGPDGNIVLPAPSESFQTARERHFAQGSRFSLAIGESRQDPTPDAMRMVIDSETRLNWRTTLEPFRRELPAGCDWVTYVSTRLAPEAKTTAESWTRRDASSDVLQREFVDPLVRRLVLKHANADLAVAAYGGVAVAQDPLHSKVASLRFADVAEWRPIGFVLPILHPRVENLDWESIAEVRRNRHVRRFREVMAEIEARALEEAAAGGDIEETAHHAYETYLADAVERFTGVGGTVLRAGGSMLIGSVAGAATVGWSGPVGIVGGAAVGAAPEVLVDVVKQARRKRQNGWIALHQRLGA